MSREFENKILGERENEGYKRNIKTFWKVLSSRKRTLISYLLEEN